MKLQLKGFQIYYCNSLCDVALKFGVKGEKHRLWKDHLKNDLRSDQDHRQKIDLRSRSRSRFLKI
jgi:hypothetical protein